MHIITKKLWQEFWLKHPQAKEPLSSWYKLVKQANWENLAETKADFSHADLVGVCTIFNISSNKYRLITKIYYPNKKVLIRFVLTHAEYNYNKTYKDDCEF